MFKIKGTKGKDVQKENKSSGKDGKRKGMTSAEAWPCFVVNNSELKHFDRLKVELAPIGAKNLAKAGSRPSGGLMLMPEVKQFLNISHILYSINKTHKKSDICPHKIFNIDSVSFLIEYNHLFSINLTYIKVSLWLALMCESSSFL